MPRWVLVHVPPLVLLVLLLLTSTAIALALVWYVRRRFPGLQRGDHNEMATFGFSVVGVVYGFIIGFIVLSQWQEIDVSDGIVRTEAAAAIQVTNGLAALDVADRDKIRHGMIDYERASLAEWPQAASGHPSAQADEALDRLYETFGKVEARNDWQRETLRSSMDSLKQSSMARRERLLAAGTLKGPGFSLWLVILMTSAVVLAFAVAFGAQNGRMHYAMVSVVAMLVAANIFLIIELAYPFIGEISASSDPLRTAIEILQTE